MAAPAAEGGVDGGAAATPVDKEKQKLLLRREELVSLLRSIRHSLEAGGQPPIEERPFDGSQPRSAWLWSPRTETFTVRGADKVHELYERFCSVPGRMTYFDFRGYLHALRRLDEFDPHIIDSEEAWRSYMTDMFGTDEAGGLTPGQFLAYREWIESQYPLEADLLSIGLPLLPDTLIAWKQCEAAFDRLADEGITEEEKFMLLRAGEEYISNFPRCEFQLFAYDNGEIMSDMECERLLTTHQDRLAVMCELLGRHRKASRLQVDEEGNAGGESLNPKALYRASTVALWFSNWPKLPHRDFEAAAIQFKSMIRRAYRMGLHGLKSVMGTLNSVSERGLIVDSLVARLKQEVGRYGMEFRLGADEGVLDAGFSMTLSLRKLTNSTAGFAELGMPGGLGTAFLVDFLIRSEVPDKAVTRAASALEAMLNEHCKYELERVPSFKLFRVFKHTHEADHVPVLRVAFAWKPESSIDFVLRRLNIGVKFSDILLDLTMTLHSSLGLTDILEGRKTIIDESLKVQATGNLVCARRLVAKLLEEIVRSPFEANAAAEIELAEQRRDYATAFQRTKQVVLEKFKGVSQALKDIKEVSITGLQEPPTSQTSAEQEHTKQRENWVQRQTWRMLRWLQSTKSCTLDFSYTSASEAVLKNPWSQGWFADLGLEDFTTPGAIYHRWIAFQQYLGSQIQESLACLRKHKIRRKRWDREEEAARLKESASMTQRQRREKELREEKKRMAARLLSMGLEVTADLEEDDTSGISPVELMRLLVTKQFKTEEKLQGLYGDCWAALVAVHGVQVQSGENRLTLSFQGLDLFELLPEPEHRTVDAADDEAGGGT